MQDKALVTGLLEHDQEHLFRSWPPLGTQDDDKRRLLAQLRQLDDNYAGGLIKYITNAKRLLQESKEGEGAGWFIWGEARVGGRMIKLTCLAVFMYTS